MENFWTYHSRYIDSQGLFAQLFKPLIEVCLIHFGSNNFQNKFDGFSFFFFSNGVRSERDMSKFNLSLFITLLKFAQFECKNAQDKRMPWILK